jgi:uncharacterized protein YbbC (DUF1343 family)
MQPARAQTRRVAILANHTSADRHLTPGYELLQQRADLEVALLLTPEHGLHGQAQAGVMVDDGPGPHGLPVKSLYGRRRPEWPELLAGIDVLLFDVQDVGCRYYTYTQTMLEAMRAAAAAGVLFAVLDRPNPINGVSVQGGVVQADFASLVGAAGLPVRPGLTVGEIACLFNTELAVGCELEVVRMSGWRRSMWFDATGLPWVSPSPNMPTLATATVYPGTCLLEGTNLSEGRGTTTPFQTVGAPWVDGQLWARALNDLQLPGVRFRPVLFTPWYSKYCGRVCGGVHLHVLDRSAFLPVRTGLELLRSAIDLFPEFSITAPTDDGGRCFFDLLAGSDQLRRWLLEGRSTASIARSFHSERNRFLLLRDRYLLY